MSGFTDGFRIVQDFTDARDRRGTQAAELELRQAADARAAESHALQQRVLSGQADDQDRVRTATTNLSDAATRGLRVPDAYDVGYKADGTGLPRPPTMPDGSDAPAPAYRPATREDMNRLELGLATAKGDLGGAKNLRDESYRMSYDKGIAGGMAQWGKMKPEERAAFVMKQTEDASSPFNVVPTATKGKDGRPSYMAWVEGKPRVHISDQEAAFLFANANLMRSHPDLARAEILKGPEKIRALAKDYFTMTDAQMKTNNQGIHFRNTDEESLRHHQAVEGQGAERLSIMNRSDAREDAAQWMPVGVSSDGKGLAVYNKVTHEVKNQPLPPGTDAIGLFRKLTGNVPERPIDEKAVETIVGELRGAKENKGVPYESLRAKAVSILDPRRQGGMPNVYGGEAGGSPQAAPAPVAAGVKKPVVNWAARPPLFDPVQTSADKDRAFAEHTSMGLTR